MREFPDDVLYDAGVPPALPVPPEIASAALPPTMIRERRALRACAAGIVCACALFAAAGATGQALGVATWNVGWLLDEAAHARWTSVCARNGWPRDTAALPVAERAALAPLPFCDVHNGMPFPPERCRAARDGWPDAARYPADHPCRETADLAEWDAYARKVAALRAMFRRLDEHGVSLVALQEVFDAPAAQAILPAGWSVATTRELPGTPAIAQHVGVAWRRGVRVRDVTPVNALADGGVPGRPLRPGLAFTVDVGGRPVRALAVHLKAGCRSRNLDAPLTKADAKLPPERQDAIASDCAMLRFQLPALEAWIDAHAHRDFAVLGDFNRTLLREPVADSATYRTRLDGSSAQDPVGPCTMARAGERWVAECGAQTRALFPELNDGHPDGAVLWRARFADQSKGGTIRKGSSGDCALASARGDLTHDGIDHVLISESLKRRLEPSALTMRVENYTDAAGAPLRADPALALPSDHCPHVVVWTPKRRP
jgi:endonuclease/exonuclease/phosphatase family metal-dependent hydrolase